MQPNAHGIGMPRLGAPSGKVSCQLCCLSPTLPPLTTFGGAQAPMSTDRTYQNQDQFLDLCLYMFFFGVIHSDQFQSKNLLVTFILQIHTFQLISCRGWFPVMMIWKQSQALSELIKTTVVWLDSKVNCRGRHWLQIFLQVFKTSEHQTSMSRTLRSHVFYYS